MLRLLDQTGPISQQTIASSGCLFFYVIGHGKDLSPLLCSQHRRDERPAVPRGLSHDHAKTQPTDDPIATREMMTVRRRPHRKLGQDSAVLFDLFPKSIML